MKIGRKITGGKYHTNRKKRLHERDSQSKVSKLGKDKTRLMRSRSGYFKTIVLTSDTANIIDKKGKSKKAKIKNVLETPSNKFLARQNIFVKGAIIETDLGKARITNHPSQEGNIQDELLD